MTAEGGKERVPTAEKGALRDFFDWAIRAAWNGNNLDGGEIQEKALELGLIKRVPYNFDNHGPRGRHDFGLNDGDDWYVKAPSSHQKDESNG